MAALANLVLWHLGALFVDVLLIALRWAVPCCSRCWVGEPVMTHLLD